MTYYLPSSGPEAMPRGQIYINSKCSVTKPEPNYDNKGTVFFAFEIKHEDTSKTIRLGG